VSLKAFSAQLGRAHQILSNAQLNAPARGMRPAHARKVEIDPPLS
jgi:hypothetical protein